MEAPQTSRLDGFLLTFAPKDFQRIKDMLIEGGYSPDSDGLRDFITDAADEEPVRPEHRVGQMVGEFIAQNPEVLSGGAKMAGKIVGAFMKRRK